MNIRNGRWLILDGYKVVDVRKCLFLNKNPPQPISPPTSQPPFSKNFGEMFISEAFPFSPQNKSFFTLPRTNISPICLNVSLRQIRQKHKKNT